MLVVFGCLSYVFIECVSCFEVFPQVTTRKLNDNNQSWWSKAVKVYLPGQRKQHNLIDDPLIASLVTLFSHDASFGISDIKVRHSG